MTRPVVILFAKAPVAGRVKTRLGLDPAAAARLHSAFVGDMLEKLGSVGADVELHTDVETDAWSAPTLRLQVDGDLGVRMLTALTDALARGHSRALVAGADAPTLPVSHLEALLGSPADVALGPAEDGGYYAISCRRVDPRMFDGVAWSEPATLEGTVAAVRRRGLTVALGPSWYDIDSPADLERLRAEPRLPPRTAAWMRIEGCHST